MNLTEKMALDCGVKSSQPYLDQYFLPLKSDRFIIFDTRCKNVSGEYDYYNDVYDLIKDYDVTVAKKLHMWGNGL